MTTRLTPYGSTDQAQNLSKVGKSKTPLSLAQRMPSPDIVAKVGKGVTPFSLAARMPSPEIAAKVGSPSAVDGVETRRVVRRTARV
ncbi:MAG: hypothetical protein R3E09_14675 [Novosphingobium sp.]|nr:hypothetical protein [Novosphingobium sp.]